MVVMVTWEKRCLNVSAVLQWVSTKCLCAVNCMSVQSKKSLFGFVTKCQCFESDAGSYRKPVGSGGVAMGMCGRTWEGWIWASPRCKCILDQLQGSNDAQRQTCLKWITEVQSWDEKGVNKYQSGLCGNKWTNPPDVEKGEINMKSGLISFRL